MAFHIMRMVLLLSQKLGRAEKAEPGDSFKLELINYVLLKLSGMLKLVQSIPVCLLPLYKLFLYLLVLGSVAMFCVHFLALKAFKASYALVLITF